MDFPGTTTDLEATKQFDPVAWDNTIMEKKTLTLLEFWAYNNTGLTSIARVRLLSTDVGLAVEHRLLSPQGRAGDSRLRDGHQ
jgi:hypothetical protein